MPGLDAIVDLADRGKHLAPHRQAAAVKWCEKTDTDSAEMLVLLDKEPTRQQWRPRPIMRARARDAPAGSDSARA